MPFFVLSQQEMRVENRKEEKKLIIMSEKVSPLPNQRWMTDGMSVDR